MGDGSEGRGRVFELFVEVSNSRGLGLLRLAGSSPNPYVEFIVRIHPASPA